MRRGIPNCLTNVCRLAVDRGAASSSTRRSIALSSPQAHAAAARISKSSTAVYRSVVAVDACPQQRLHRTQIATPAISASGEPMPQSVHCVARGQHLADESANPVRAEEAARAVGKQPTARPQAYAARSGVPGGSATATTV